MAAMSGVEILERGGNAVDAAIATNAVLGLMEPVNNGIGGDLFAIVYESKTGKLYGLNASGWASKAETPEMLRAKGITKMPESGAWTVTVPGAVAGWAALQQRFGTKPLSELLSSASTTPKTVSRSMRSPLKTGTISKKLCPNILSPRRPFL
ncbi:MAG: hypothetical protein NVS1B11_32360 [Terriglobales bacterium]